MFSGAVENCLILIPVHNEADHLSDLLRECQQFPFQIWVIDDSSSDNSAAIAEQTGATVIRLKRRHGKTAALRVALERISRKVTWILFMDGDGQHHPSDIGSLWNEREGVDCVWGSRWPGIEQMPYIRRITNYWMSFILNRITGGNHPDTQCGFRLVRADTLRSWRPRGHFFEFESELYCHLHRTGARIKSIPIQTIYKNEKSKIFWPRDTWRFFIFLYRMGKVSLRSKIVDLRF